MIRPHPHHPTRVTLPFRLPRAGVILQLIVHRPEIGLGFLVHCTTHIIGLLPVKLPEVGGVIRSWTRLINAIDAFLPSSAHHCNNLTTAMQDAYVLDDASA